MVNRVAILGDSVGAARASLTLAELGIDVNIISPTMALGLDYCTDNGLISSPEDMPHIWPLLLRTASHPLVNVRTDTTVHAITGRPGKFTIKSTRKPRYVRRDLCNSCGRCEEECSVKLISTLGGQRIGHSAIHAPVPGAKTVPSAYRIEKNGIAPCRWACPLGINVQGFVSLLSKGKVNEALSLINEAAPLAGVLGRVCTHPCESNCKRSELDSPVFIQALHRYAWDNASDSRNYRHKAPPRSRREKIAIIGSGPAGLTAAWDLARRGYTPTIFESHAVVGGMLATGIPRFRLPREVRDREVEAIKDLGVDIKTGVTVGRDVSITDLRERGYRAFFLAIGAHQNKTLNIPGEHLEGVVDGVSLLFALNLKVGASVGSNVVVIGGGNSAVDSARTVKRRSKGDVRILYRRTEDEMTAVKEEVEDAIREGISIEYLTMPIEILGDGVKVTGLRCQRMKLGEIEADGRRRPVPVPGSEYVIDADHVVIAIGQKPNTSMLNMMKLETDSNSANIVANPLTLETSIDGVFAGGDCVTGPNNVVESMAAGLRAAESMDRYLKRRDMTKGRSLVKPEPVEVDIRERDASYYKRAHMPAIPFSRRKGSFEETMLGLAKEIGEREAARCLNCASCSECMECESVCELKAVNHKDDAEQVDIAAEIIIDFTSDNKATEEYLVKHNVSGSTLLKKTGAGIYTIEEEQDDGIEGELIRASAVALEAAIELKTKEEALTRGFEPPENRTGNSIDITEEIEPVSSAHKRVGVILCSCGGMISSVIDFNQITNEVLQLPGVCNIQETSQACSEEGARSIVDQAKEWKLDTLVVAACRCCSLDQICFSCTERRVMCLYNLGRSLGHLSGTGVEFVNIREHCAKVHRDRPNDATCKAADIISSGVARALTHTPADLELRALEARAVVLGTNLTAQTAAEKLVALGYPVTLIPPPRSDGDVKGYKREKRETETQPIEKLRDKGIVVLPQPLDLELNGTPGNYEVVLKYPSRVDRIRTGAVIVDIGQVYGEGTASFPDRTDRNLLRRIVARGRQESYNLARTDKADLRGFTIGETAGIFAVSLEDTDSQEEQIIRGMATAAVASTYLHQTAIRPRWTAVTIDRKLCRGCGDCAAICSYIEMQAHGNGVACAYLDESLCLGCGACITCCPTGAITQYRQSDEQIIGMLESLIGKTPVRAEAHEQVIS